MQGKGFVDLPSLLYHPYLVCILFRKAISTSFYIFNVFLSLVYLGTEAVVAVIGEVSFIVKINADLRRKNTFPSWSFRLYLVQRANPYSDS